MVTTKARSFIDDFKQRLTVRRDGKVRRPFKVAAYEALLRKFEALQAENAQLRQYNRRLGPLGEVLRGTEPALVAAVSEAFAQQLRVTTAGLAADLNGELDLMQLETDAFFGQFRCRLTALSALHHTAKRLLETSLNVAEAQKELM